MRRPVLLVLIVILMLGVQPLNASKKKSLEPLTIFFGVDPELVEIFKAAEISQDPSKSLDRMRKTMQKKRMGSGLTLAASANEADIVATMIGLSAPYVLIRVETRDGSWATFAGIKGGRWANAVDHVSATVRNWIVANYDSILAARNENP